MGVTVAVEVGAAEDCCRLGLRGGRVALSQVDDPQQLGELGGGELACLGLGLGLGLGLALILTLSKAPSRSSSKSAKQLALCSSSSSVASLTAAAEKSVFRLRRGSVVRVRVCYRSGRRRKWRRTAY